MSEVIRFDQQGRHSAAIESYRQALGFDPNSAIARVNLGWRYYTGEQYEEAITEFLYVEDSEYRRIALFNRGLAHLTLGSTEKARKA